MKNKMNIKFNKELKGWSGIFCHLYKGAVGIDVVQ